MALALPVFIILQVGQKADVPGSTESQRHWSPSSC
jgi:hypothetical protein